MLKVIILLVCSTALVACAAVGKQLSFQFEVKDKLEGSQANEPLRSVGQDYHVVTHTLGKLLDGDQLVGETVSDEVYSWDEPHDVHGEFSFSVPGEGSVVHYIEVKITQSSDSGDAYITRGAIGQRDISVAVVATDTLYFSWDIKIYGTQ